MKSAKQSKKNIKPAPDKKENKKTNALFSKNVILFAGLIIATILVYSGVLDFNFVNIDDSPKIMDNLLIKDLSGNGMKSIFTSYVFHSYLPITIFFQAVIYHIWGLSPAAFHFFNLFFHLLCTTGLFLFIYRLTQKNIKISFITTALFALHPMNVETVAWASEFSNVLFGTFYVFSLWFYLKYHDQRKNIFYILSIFMFLLSVMSKSSAVPLSVSLFLIDYLRSRKLTLKLILEKIPFLAISIIFGLIAIHAMSSTGGFRNLESVYNLSDRLFLITYPLAFYLLKFLFPFNLSVFNAFPDKSPDGFLPVYYYISILLIAACVFFVFKAKKIKKELVFGFLFFLFNIGLLINIIPFGGDFITTEHFVYIPYIGFAFIVGFLYQQISENKILRKITPVVPYLIAVYLIFYSVQSWSRKQVWENSISLFKDAVENNPDNATANLGLGSAYQEAGRFTEAIKYYDQAIQIRPKYTEAFYNRGNVNLQLKNPIAAIEDFSSAIKSDSTYYIAYNNRGNVKKTTGDTLGAIQDYTHCVRLDSNYAPAFYNRGSLYSNLKNYPEALKDLSKSITIKTDYTDAYINRGVVYYYLKDYENSLKDYNEAIRLQPKNFNALKNRGLSYLALKDSVSACNDWHNALIAGYKPIQGLIKKHCGGK